MKKSLIALAVMAASGATFAQSVSLYGIADVWLGSVKAGGGSRTTVLESGGVSGSRWGLKGSEDLGGGLKANFLLEQGFAIDTGATAAGQAFARQSYVGFSGGFGEVKLGKMWTAYDDISGATNPAFDSALSPQNNVWYSTGYDANPANGIYYASPSMGGISGAFSYSLDEKTAGRSAVTALHVKYEGGPLYVGFAYQNQNPYGPTAATKFIRLNGSYDLGAAKVLAGYGKVDYPGSSANATDWELGADVPMSSTLTLSGGVAGSKLDGVKKTGYALAAAYSLSKRTTLYGGFHSSSTKNTDAGDLDVLAVGVKHTF